MVFDTFWHGFSEMIIFSLQKHFLPDLIIIIEIRENLYYIHRIRYGIFFYWQLSRDNFKIILYKFVILVVYTCRIRASPPTDWKPLTPLSIYTAITNKIFWKIENITYFLSTYSPMYVLFANSLHSPILNSLQLAHRNDLNSSLNNIEWAK